MRGGLDDALEKLARRDELRRRAAGDATGTPPAVTELVEAIAAVVARNPALGVTVGVEGAGDPLLLHFYSEDGVVQVNADNSIAARAAEPEATAPRHADFDIEVGEPVEEQYQAPADDPDGATRRLSHDDQDRYGPATFGYQEPDDQYFNESPTAERRYGNFDAPPATQDARYPAQDPGETSRDLGARMRDLGMASREVPAQPPQYPPHPFAATPPPPVPPQTPRNQNPPAQATRRIQPEQYRAPAEPSAAERIPHQPGPYQQAAEQRGGMPTPLPQPIPLQVERPEETEMAARRLAALLRDDPSLLNQGPE
ncbi:hypothetical protein ACWKSP_17650 [Micromonosporaceae bacterium Da 78-11]